jgi:pimeloyl-ACP methyl ester carboxylesterase/class 3 adenylate cyclase
LDVLRSGQDLLHYHIVDKIGQGGMGEVYKAEDVKLRRPVAIKLLPAGTAKDQEAKHRFLREARSASALNHLNIITIYALEETEDLSFIVMEYIQGESLLAINERQALSLTELLDVGSQVADALAAAHSVGLIHRDIKPANIVITPHGQAKVLDFGLAKMALPIPGEIDSLAATRPADLTAAGSVMGTIAYMSPEQARGEPLDARTDIFSLGVLLYEATTGRMPFNGPNLISILQDLALGNPPSPSIIAPHLPKGLDAIIQKALAKCKEDRYSSATELSAALRGLKDSLGGTFGLAPANRPETRYARSGDINIAYQVVGEGPIDLVYVPGWVSNVEEGWEEPLLARFFERLASFSRLIIFDKRGTGLSDQTTGLPALEQRMDDVRAVMEAAGSERAVLFGISEGSGMCLLFAATYPERTASLIVFGAFASRVWAPDYPWAPTSEQRQKFFDAIEHEWGGPLGVEELAPSVAQDERFRRWFASFQRRSVSPGAALALAHMNTSIDVRQVLPAIRVPTLVIHRTRDRDANIEEGRYIAARIPGARFVELPGEDHLPFVGDQVALFDEIEKFLAGIQGVQAPESMLATVLFAEARGATAGPTEMEPRVLRDRLMTISRREIEWFKGREGVTEGDRPVAAFDGPARAIRAACAISQSAERVGIEVGVGLHAGECQMMERTIGGVAVDIGAEVARRAAAGEVLVSSTVKDLVAGSDIRFEDRGVYALDGNQGEWRLYRVERSQLAGG